MEACCRELLGKSRVEKRCEEWCREVVGKRGVERGVEKCWGRGNVEGKRGVEKRWGM